MTWPMSLRLLRGMRAHEHPQFATLLLLLLALAVFAAPAAAQILDDDTPPPPLPSKRYDHRGGYFGIQGFYAMETFDRSIPIDLDIDIDGGDTGGLGVRAGYRANSHVAGELLFQYYDQFMLSYSLDGAPRVRELFGGWSLTGNAKLFALRGRVQPYGVLGIGALVLDREAGSEAAFAARFGAGLDFYLTRNWILDAEIGYVLPTGSLSDFPILTFGAGAQYRF